MAVRQRQDEKKGTKCEKKKSDIWSQSLYHWCYNFSLEQSQKQEDTKRYLKIDQLFFDKS